MDILRCARARIPIERFEDGQGFNNRQPASRERRRVDRVFFPVQAVRLDLPCMIAGQIGCGDQSSVFLEIICELPGDIAAVKRINRVALGER